MRIIKFKYRLLDKKENIKRLLKVVKCSISHDSLARLKYSANLTIENSEDIDFNKKNISNVEVFNNKDIVIEYSDETYEHYIPKLIQTSNYNEYKIVKIE